MTVKRICAYYRVSTDSQKRSNLGLEAQKATVAAYVKTNDATLVAEFEEVESGTRSDRPRLRAAISMCKRTKACLCVAKLDRLARSCSFVSALLESRVEFVACDAEFANTMTLQILASVSEHEARMISTRTKDALKAKRARGFKLGSAREGHWDGREHLRLAGSLKGGRVSAKLRSEQARKDREEFAPHVETLLQQGMTYAQVAQALNDEGWTTPKGRPWNEVYVCRFVKAVGISKQERSAS